jgi:uncharacterized protein (UPF0261 family)
LIRHSPQITDLRLNQDEMAAVAREVACRLSHTRDRAIFMVPSAGFDCYAVKGQGLHDCEADARFVRELEANLPRNVEIIERDTHIDDESFAIEAAQLLSALIQARKAT